MAGQKSRARGCRVLHGRCFRFECKGDELNVHGMAASLQSLAGSIIALVTTSQTVQVSCIGYVACLFVTMRREQRFRWFSSQLFEGVCIHF